MDDRDTFVIACERSLHSYPSRFMAPIMLSQRTRYTIRALQHLADHYGKGPIQLSHIAEAQNIPAKFLTVILSEMRRAGLVATMRGKDGGYWLARAPADISYGDIVRLTRGSLALVPCASRYAHETCKNCLEESRCRLRRLMLRVRNETAQVLDGISLGDPVPLEAQWEDALNENIDLEEAHLDMG